VVYMDVMLFDGDKRVSSHREPRDVSTILLSILT
jgi:hypothetical protein